MITLNVTIARFSIRDLLLLTAIVAVFCASISNLPVLPGFNRRISSIFFGAGAFGAFGPSVIGAWIRYGITSVRCWNTIMGAILASGWANLFVLYQLCLIGSRSPNWPNMAGAGLIILSPLFGFIASCLVLSLLRVASLGISVTSSKKA